MSLTFAEVIVVEDDAEDRRAIAQAVADASGLLVRTFDRPERALEHLRDVDARGKVVPTHNRPALAVLDWQFTGQGMAQRVIEDLASHLYRHHTECHAIFHSAATGRAEVRGRMIQVHPRSQQLDKRSGDLSLLLAVVKGFLGRTIGDVRFYQGELIHIPTFEGQREPTKEGPMRQTHSVAVRLFVKFRHPVRFPISGDSKAVRRFRDWLDEVDSSLRVSECFGDSMYMLTWRDERGGAAIGTVDEAGATAEGAAGAVTLAP